MAKGYQSARLDLLYMKQRDAQHMNPMDICNPAGFALLRCMSTRLSVSELTIVMCVEGLIPPYKARHPNHLDGRLRAGLGLPLRAEVQLLVFHQLCHIREDTML